MIKEINASSNKCWELWTFNHISERLRNLWYFSIWYSVFNTLRPRQNYNHFTDDIFKCILLNENVWISLKISLTFVTKVRINNITALVQIIAWRRPGGKPLSEPMMVTLLTHVCVTWPHWVNNWGSISVRIPWHVILLSHWGQLTHICVSDLIIIDWGNGLSPARRLLTYY